MQKIDGLGTRSARVGRVLSAAVLATLGCAVVNPAQASDTRYTVELLNLPVNTSFSSGKLGTNGQIVGRGATRDNDGNLVEQFPASYANGSLTRLGTLGAGDRNNPRGVNASGLIVGSSSDGAGSPNRATIFRRFNVNPSSVRIDTPWLSGYYDTFARAVNDSGKIALDTYSTASPMAGTVFRSNVFDASTGQRTEIPLLAAGGLMESADINNQGWVVGYATNAQNRRRAFLFDGSVTRDLGMPASVPTSATVQASEINEAGAAVGMAAWYNASNQFTSEAVLYKNGAAIRLGTGRADSINSAGEIIGSIPAPTAYEPNAVKGGFWTAGGFVPLDDLLPASSAYKVGAVSGIDDQGRILASLYRKDDENAIPARFMALLKPVAATVTGTSSASWSDVKTAGNQAPTASDAVRLSASSGLAVSIGSGTTANAGSLFVANTSSSTTTLTVNGTLNAGNGAMVGDGGVVGGSGTINGSVTSMGTIAPGNSPGVLTITGDYNQAGGVLDIEIASAISFDVLNVGGNATLSGLLDVAVDYNAQLGQFFDVVLADDISLSNLRLVDPFFGDRTQGLVMSIVTLEDGESLRLTVVEASAVPEPAGLTAAAIGLCAILLPRRRRRA